MQHLSSLNRRGATKVASRSVFKRPVEGGLGDYPPYAGVISQARSTSPEIRMGPGADPRWPRTPPEAPAGKSNRVCLNGAMPSPDQVIDALRAVIDPELRRDIVELEMVRSVDIHENGVVDVMVSLATPGWPIRSHFETGVAAAVRTLAGVPGVNISFDVLPDSAKEARGRKLGRYALR